MKCKRIIEAILYTQMDHLKDAERMLDFADDMKELGESNLANMFLSQAKTRISAAMDCDHTLDTYKQRLVDEAARNNVPFNMDEHNGYAMAYKKYTASTVDSLKRRCDTH